MRKIRSAVNRFLFNAVSRVHIHPRVTYIRWLGYEWIIPR